MADNADPAAPGQLIAAAQDRFGRLDGALISVGGSPAGTIADTTDDAWRSAFESVFLGAVRLARVLAGHLAGRRDDDSLSGTGGSIAFVLAASVRAPLPGLGISNGLFPGLAGVVKTLADELGPAGIRINGLLPVRIATDRVRQFDALFGDPDEVRARQSQNIPLRRYGEVGRVRAGRGVHPVARRGLHHRRDDPDRRRGHPVHLSPGRTPPRPAAEAGPATPIMNAQLPFRSARRTRIAAIVTTTMSSAMPEATRKARSKPAASACW